MPLILGFPRQDCARLVAGSIVPWQAADAGLPMQWRQRAEVEHDESWLQIIPYVVIIDLSDRPWTYRRCGGDGRLLDRRSVGVGGHVEEEDRRESLLATVRAGMLREIEEELVTVPKQLAQTLEPLAWINEQDSAIGRVHLGLVFALPWGLLTAPKPQRGEALIGEGFCDPSQVVAERGFEVWSLLAIQALKNGNPS